MITLKHGCDLTDVLATCRFALLVRSSQWNRKIQCRSSCRQMLNLFELFGAAFLFIWWHLFLALHSCTWPLQPTGLKSGMWKRLFRQLLPYLSLPLSPTKNEKTTVDLRLVLRWRTTWSC